MPHHGLDLVGPRRALHGRRLPARRAHGARAASRRGPASPSSSAAPGLYLRAVARGLPLEAGRQRPTRSAPRSRPVSPRMGCEPLVAELRARDPRRAGAHRHAEPASRRPRAGAGHRERARRQPPPPLGYAGAGRSGSACLASRRATAPAIEERARAPVRGRAARRGRSGCGQRYPRGPAGLQRDGLPGGLRRPRGARRPRDGHRRRRRAGRGPTRAASAPGSGPSPTSPGWRRGRGGPREVVEVPWSVLAPFLRTVGASRSAPGRAPPGPDAVEAVDGHAERAAPSGTSRFGKRAPGPM